MEATQRLHLLDCVISAFLFTPITVLLWHGSFLILDDVILRENPFNGPWIILTIGISLQSIAAILKTKIYDVLNLLNPKAQKFMGIFYNFFLGFAQILQFRALNDIYDIYVGSEVQDAVSATVTSGIILSALKISTQILDVPFTLSVDNLEKGVKKEHFEFRGYHGTKSDVTFNHVLDIFSTISLVQSFAHVYLIAAWFLVDFGLYKTAPFLSMLASWVLGYGLLMFLWIISDLLKSWTDFGKDSVFTRFLADFIVLAQGMVITLIWHGYWVMYDIINYWFPIQVLGFALTPYLQVVLAMALMTSLGFTSGLVRNGISPDENEGIRSSIGMNAQYFKHFYDQELESGVRKSTESSTRKASKNSFKKNGRKNSENFDGNNNNQQPMSAKQVPNHNNGKRVSNNNNNRKHMVSGETSLKKRKKISLQDLVEIERAKRGKKKKNQ